MSKVGNKLLMIVGMHRSGTSAVGKLLQLTGFEFGNNLLEGIQSVNDEGFWEDRDVVALNQHIFSLYGFDWFDFERLPGKWWEEERVRELVGIAETWYMESFSGDSPIAVKDPRFCRLLPFWKRAFAGLGLEVHILFVFRHPAEVAASLRKRDGFPMQLGYLLWLSYAIDALYYSRNMDLGLLQYDDLIEKKPAVLQRLKSLIESCGLRADGLDEHIDNAIDSSRKHQHHTLGQEDLSASGDIKALAYELYDELKASDSESAKGLADKYRKRLYRLLDHHAEVLAALQEGIRNRVIETQRVFKLGEQHSHALSVIHEKDAQLEENRNFIDRCLEEIRSKDRLLQTSSAGEKPVSDIQSYANKFDAWMADIKSLIEDYRKQIDDQKKYIVECEEKIEIQQKGLAENQEYIARCHARIAEQDAGIAENRGYISACEERIRVQDEGLAIRDRSIEEKTEKLLELEKALIAAQDQLRSDRTILEQHEGRIHQLVTELQRFESERPEMEARLLKAEQQVNDLQANLLQKEAQLVESSDRIIHLQHVVGEHQEKLRSQTQSLSERENALSSLEFNLQEKNREIGEVTERLRITQIELSEFSEKISVQDDLIRSALREQGEYSEKLRTTCSERDVLRSKLDEQERLLQENHREQGSLMQQLRSVNAEVDVLRAKLDEQAKQIQSLERESGEALEKLRVACRESEILAVKTSEQGSLIKKQDQQISELAQKLHFSEGAVETLRLKSIDQVEALDKQGRELGERTAALEATRQDLANAVIRLNEQAALITSCDSEIARLKGLDQVNHQRLTLQKMQLEKARAHAAALESEMVALKAELAEKLTQIDRYRSYRIVKAIDKLFPEKKQ